jgi:hypothetical protein
MMAKKATTAKSTKRAKSVGVAKRGARGSQKRETLKRGDKNVAFAKRRTDGTFKEIDDSGRSLSADRTRKAKKAVKAGFGDQGDRRAAKKR